MRIRSKLTKEERTFLREVVKVADSWKFVAGQISINTALIPGGQKVAKQFEAVAKLMEQTKETMIANKLTQLGYPQGVGFNINLTTGRISRVKHQAPPQPQTVPQTAPRPPKPPIPNPKK